jgi:NADH-ubiquinone oxidoreductase chain 5
MIFACGLSNYSVGVFHLMNHAFFKALLFLSAGSVIHALSDEQDMRKMGGLVQLLPFTYAMMCIGSFSLVGFPFLTGFYSKDVILEIAYAKYTISGNFAYWLGSVCVLLTSYYSFRLLFLTFLNLNSGFRESLKKTHDAPFLMAFPLIFLAFGSIFVGYLAKDMMIGLGTNFWSNSLFVLPKNLVLLESEFIPQSDKFLPFYCTLTGAFLAYLVNYAKVFQTYKFKTTELSRNLYYFLNKRWFFDKVYNDFIVSKALNFGYNISFKTLDKGSFEILGPTGIARTIGNITQYFSKLQSGMLYHYALVMLLGLTLLITTISIWEFLEIFIDNRLYFIYLISFIFYNYFNIDFVDINISKNKNKLL